MEIHSKRLGMVRCWVSDEFPSGICAIPVLLLIFKLIRQGSKAAGSAGETVLGTSL
jgi:hypothetical protein